MIANAQDQSNELITLTQAAKIAPGRPSIHCLWRWCRRGVKARSGETVHLEHLRLGGKLYTKAQWLHDFGERLAAADTAHFQRRRDGHADHTPVHEASRNAHLRQIDAELQEAGL